jgi:hypothetical protein
MTFQPGQSGNPAGRPRGVRNKRTVIAQQMLDEHAADVTQGAIDLAKAGDRVALRVCMDRIAPPLRHRLLDFDLPELTSAADAVVAAKAIIQGAAKGELTVPEANGLMRLVRTFVLLLAAAAREKRLAHREANDGAQAAHAPARDASLDGHNRIISVPRPRDGVVAPVPAAAAADLDPPVPARTNAPASTPRVGRSGPATAGDDPQSAESPGLSNGSVQLGSFGAATNTLEHRQKLQAGITPLRSAPFRPIRNDVHALREGAHGRP